VRRPIRSAASRGYFYGATVTLEGECVFRPLPPHDRVIINPGSKTPFSLGIYESTSYNANYNYNYDEGFAAVPDFGGSSFGFIPGRKHFVVIAPGTKATCAPCAARSPEPARLSQRASERLSLGEGRAS
jgi:hypothetical protein